MTETYQDRQKRLLERAQELTLAHPHLAPRSTQTKAQPGWVATNMRNLFKHHWPGVPCSTKTDRWSAGTSIALNYIDVPGAPTSAEALEKLMVFQSQRYNSEEETFDFDTDFEREAFRKAFGGTSKVYANAREPSPEEHSRHLRKALPKSLNKTGKPRF